MKKLLLCAGLLLSTPHAYAVGPLALVGWAGLGTAITEIAQDVSTDLITEYLKGVVKKDALDRLQAKVDTLDKQLQAQQAAEPAADFSQLKALLDNTNKIINGINLQVKHNTDKLNTLDSKQAQMHDVIALLQNEVADLRALLDARGVELKKPLADVNSLNILINYAYRPKDQTELLPLSEGTVLHSGDYYKITFTPQQEAWVYIFQTDSSGKVYQLFPLKEMNGVALNQSNPVKGGQQYTAPAPQMSFFLDQQTGTETLYFIAAPEQDSGLEASYRAYQEALRQPQADLRSAKANLDTALYSRGPGGAAPDPAVTRKHSVPKDGGDATSMNAGYLAGLCSRPGGCVNVLTFEHR
jgi:hypothetical protein